MRLHRAAALLAFTGVAAAFGCSLIADYDGFDTGANDAAAGDAACGKTIPGKPFESEAGTGPDLVAITSRIQLAPAADGGISLGYNLDRICNVCSSAITRGACNINGDFTKPCDEPGGVDNQLSRSIGLLFSDTSGLDRDLAAGREGVLVHVQGYNGKPDDTQVSVAVFNIASLNDGGAAKFDGTDVVAVTNDSLVTSSTPPPPNTIPPQYFDLDAYVTGGVLVANLSSFRLRLLIPDFLGGADAGDAGAPLVANIPFSEAKLVGHIVVKGNGFTMNDGQIVGRVTLADIASQLAVIGYCGDGIPATVKSQVCNGLDLAGRSNDDGANAACSAVSAAVGLTLVGAKLDSHQDAATSEPRCALTPLKCP